MELTWKHIVAYDPERGGRMSDREKDAIRDALRGDVEPLKRFGVMVLDIPWWRRRVQRYVMPGRFRLWWQRRVLAAMEEE